MPRSLQAVLAVLGRLLLSAIFLLSSVGTDIPKFDGMSGAVAGLTGAAAPVAKFLLVGAIALKIIGSLSVIAGYKARFGALLMAIFLIPATYYFHNFWNLAADSKEYQDQMIHFMKNVALLGAMLFIMAVGAGPGSIDDCCGKKRVNATA